MPAHRGILQLGPHPLGQNPRLLLLEPQLPPPRQHGAHETLEDELHVQPHLPLALGAARAGAERELLAAGGDGGEAPRREEGGEGGGYVRGPGVARGEGVCQEGEEAG